jgi:hypothetical protein
MIDPDVMRAALNVIINCVCGPTSRVSSNLLKTFFFPSNLTDVHFSHDEWFRIFCVLPKCELTYKCMPINVFSYFALNFQPLKYVYVLKQTWSWCLIKFLEWTTLFFCAYSIDLYVLHVTDWVVLPSVALSIHHTLRGTTWFYPFQIENWNDVVLYALILTSLFIGFM